ncbi:MAG: hypothetical protein ACLPQ6_15985 [Steroidobacteraceae bacterium]|jgi:hypothetical protein
MLPKAFCNALLSSLIGACVLTGCASSFARFYEPASSVRGPPIAPPRFEWSSDPDKDGQQLARQGYALIGTSSFVGSNFHDSLVDQDQAVTQGIKVGAAVVLLRIDLNDVVAGGCCVRLFASYWAVSGQPAHM